MNAHLMTLLQQNRMAEAKSLCGQLCAAHPGDAQLQFLMSAICGQVGEFEESEKYCQKAIKINRNVPEAWYNLSIAQLRLGKTAAAIDSLNNALKLRPAFPEALNELGNAYQRSGDFQSAISQHQHAIRLKPNFPQALSNLAAAYMALHETQAAEKCLNTALEIEPLLTEARILLGKLLLRKGENKNALEQFNTLLAQSSISVDHLNTIAATLKDAKLLTEAEAYYKKAIYASPDNAKLLSNYGLLLTDLGRIEEAIATLTKATTIEPSMAEGFYNLSIALRTADQQRATEECYLKAVSLRKAFPEAWMNLGTLQLLQGRTQEARKCFSEALAQRPDYSDSASNLLMSLNYDEAYSADEIYQQHRRWGSALIASTSDSFKPSPRSVRNAAGIRIGFVSPDFRTHSVAYFFHSLLEPARNDVEIFCYSTSDRHDETTDNIRSKACGWREIASLSDMEAAELIDSDRLDALIDLAGHTSGNRLGIFALRPTPVQMCYLGYPNTTGLSTIDYRITDAIADPEHSEQRYTETLLRMNRCFLCYSPRPGVAHPMPIGRGIERPITFGSFNNLAKLTPEIIELWSRILRETPDSILVLKARPLGDSHVADRYRKAFQQHGIAPERLRLIGWVPETEHLLNYNQIDIALDTYPYNGTTTTCEALWMGRPVVTLCGNLHASRVGASLLSATGMPGLIARSPEQYVDIATRTAMILRSSEHDFKDIRTRIQSSSLCDSADFQKHFFDLVENAITIPKPTQKS